MANKKEWKFSTKAIHVGNEADKITGSVSPPIHLTSTFKQDAIGQTRGFDYSRVSNPTRQRVEQNLAALEGASHAMAFPQEWLPPQRCSSFSVRETISLSHGIPMAEPTVCL